MIPVINSIIHTYNKELVKLTEYFHTKVHLFAEKVKVLGRHLSPWVQMPSVYTLP